VTVVDTDGVGGSAVLTDCVPSKTLIATAELMTEVSESAELGIDFSDHEGDRATTIQVDLAKVNARVKKLAADQSTDIAARLDRDGVRVVRGRAAPRARVSRRGVPRRRRRGDVERRRRAGRHRRAPRTCRRDADGERILTWEQVYDLTRCPRS
jgi:dihydrolipoamide dehydrogenase